MTIEYHWAFTRVTSTDTENMSDFILGFTGVLTATDTANGNTETDQFSCTYEPRVGETFIDFADITPATLREWVIAYHGSDEQGWPDEPEAWLQDRKNVLAERLAARAQIRRPLIHGTVAETETPEVTP